MKESHPGSADGQDGHSHSHHHSHDHSHSHRGHHHPDPSDLTSRRLLSVAALTFVVFLAELIGGLVSGSLALLADAGHMATDSASLVIAVAAMAIGKRGVDRRATYGYRRAEVLTALVNGLTVFVIAAFILWQAISRFNSPEQHDINTGQMLAIAVIGLVTNIIAAVLLANPSKDSVNVRGAYLHVLVDAAGSVAVIISAIVIGATGWTAVDSIVSIAIAVIIIPRAWSLVRECLDVLLERTPKGVNTEAITAELLALPDVVAVHDLHVWSLSGSDLIATVHLVRADGISCDREHQLLDEAQALLHNSHRIEHATVQIEKTEHSGHEYQAHN